MAAPELDQTEFATFPGRLSRRVMKKSWNKLPPWFWGVVLIVGAVGALVVVGWLGLRSQQKSVWSDARLECGEWAVRLNKEMVGPSEAFLLLRHPTTVSSRTVTLFPEFPEPGRLEFDANADENQLKGWRGSKRFTDGGVPVRVLAGLALLRKEPTHEGAEELAEEVVVDAPSFLTPRILEEIRRVCEQAEIEFDHGQFDDLWRREEVARAAIHENKSERIRVYQGEIFWVRSKVLGWEPVSTAGRPAVAEDGPGHDRSILDALIHGRTQKAPDSPPRLTRWEISDSGDFAAALEGSLSERGPEGDRWMGAAIRVGNERVGDAGEVLAVETFPGGILEIGVVDPSVLEGGLKEQRLWVLLMILQAIVAVGAGLWVMLRGISKEKKVAYAKSQFVASVTHELRAPVGSIRLMADALESGRVRDEKVGEFHRLMARESGRLSVLIENVMDLAKVEDGQRVIQREELDLGDLVAEVLEMMSVQAREKEVTFETEGGELLVEADPVALRQILVNLIDNALKFSPAGGVVEVCWNEGWWLTVADEGPGVPDAIRARIFERFYRGEDELRRSTKGVGIGLSLVKELVELHGGTVTVKNEDGAVFRVEFEEQ